MKIIVFIFEITFHSRHRSYEFHKLDTFCETLIFGSPGVFYLLALQDIVLQYSSRVTHAPHSKHVSIESNISWIYTNYIDYRIFQDKKRQTRTNGEGDSKRENCKNIGKLKCHLARFVEQPRPVTLFSEKFL